MRRENEDYQKELLKEKDKALQKELKLKEKDAEVLRLQEEKTQMHADILRLEEKITQTENIIIEERRAGAGNKKIK